MNSFFGSALLEFSKIPGTRGYRKTGSFRLDDDNGTKKDARSEKGVLDEGFHGKVGGGLFLEENAVDCIEYGEDDNRNCEIHESSGREFDSGNIERGNNLFEERQDDAVDDEDEKPERHDDEGESENLEYWTDERVQKP